MLPPLPDDPLLASYLRVRPQLLQAARYYNQKAEKAPTLVIDNISHLAKKAPTLLELLQDLAKHTADTSELHMTFVASEGSAPRFLAGTSLLFSRLCNTTLSC